jgi:hypothetical protein
MSEGDIFGENDPAVMDGTFKKWADKKRTEDEANIRPEIRALIARGNITLTELNELRCNSWEWQAMVPAMNDEAFIDRMEYALKNCFTPARRPFSTYNEAVEGLWAPELLKRFSKMQAELSAYTRAADNYAESLDAVREALGQKETHYLCIPDDVGIAIKALEWYAAHVQTEKFRLLRTDESSRARIALAVIRGDAENVSCEACKKKLIALTRDDRVPAIFCAECGGGCEALPVEEVLPSHKKVTP